MTLVPEEIAHQRVRRALVVGIMLGVFAAAIVSYGSRAEPIAVDYRMESGCVLPRDEGQMTVAVIIEHKLVCWRWTGQ